MLKPLWVIVAVTVRCSLKHQRMHHLQVAPSSNMVAARLHHLISRSNLVTMTASLHVLMTWFT